MHALLCSLPLAIGFVATSAGSEEYVIRDVARESFFAGKLGHLVKEDLTLERDGRRLTIRVRGDYHTMCLRVRDRFAVGDRISLPAEARDDRAVDRHRIKRIARG